MSTTSPHSSPHVIDVDSENFEQAVLRASLHTPVVVDFWAEWCGPCRALGPILEKLAEEYGGRFILAKIDSDQNQELAAQFRVRGIPAVKAVVGGQVVDEFTGAQPEGAVRRFIEALLPSPAEPLYLQARAALAAGDIEGALARLDDTLAADPAHEAARLDRVELLLEAGRAAEAQSALAGMPDNVQDAPRLESLRALAELASHAANQGDNRDELETRLAADPGNLEARLALANLLASHHAFEPAVDHLLEIVRRDRKFQDDVGRKTLINLFNALGSDDDLVRRTRSRLAALLNV